MKKIIYEGTPLELAELERLQSNPARDVPQQAATQAPVFPPPRVSPDEEKFRLAEEAERIRKKLAEKPKPRELMMWSGEDKPEIQPLPSEEKKR